MKVRPITFSDLMVRAILDGCKTQTRRVVNPSPHHYSWKNWNTSERHRPCSYGAPGDELWVKVGPCDSRLTGKILCDFLDDGDGYPVLNKDGSQRSPWKSALFMPRVACRIRLRVTNVRAEPLQAISEEDAKAEGVDAKHFDPLDSNTQRGSEVVLADSCRDHFATFWNTINGKDAPWASNPWVWVVSFEKIGASQ